MKILHDTKRHVFYIDVDNGIAKLEYNKEGNILDIYETFVSKDLSGRGFAGELVKSAVTYAKDKELRIRSTCLFVKSFFRRNPEYRKFQVK